MAGDNLGPTNLAARSNEAGRLAQGVRGGISGARERYLNAGGLGILIGDGRLPHPGAEQIVEIYYDAAAVSWAHLSLDYQWVQSPGYNTDRGPVSIVAARVHAQF